MRVKAVLATAATAVALVLATAAPASAATVHGCKDDHICFYDGKGFTGAYNQHGCGSTRAVDFDFDNYVLHGGAPFGERPQFEFQDRISSVINRCRVGWNLIDISRVERNFFTGEGRDIWARSTPIYGGQWVADLGGPRGMDNRADRVQRIR